MYSMFVSYLRWLIAASSAILGVHFLMLSQVIGEAWPFGLSIFILGFAFMMFRPLHEKETDYLFTGGAFVISGYIANTVDISYLVPGMGYFTAWWLWMVCLGMPVKHCVKKYIAS